MSYTPTTWAAGDTVTSAKLNKIENGIVANEPPVICIDENDNVTASVSYNTVIEALQNNIVPILLWAEFEGRIEACYFKYIANYDDAYVIVFEKIDGNDNFTLVAYSPTELFQLYSQVEPA